MHRTIASISLNAAHNVWQEREGDREQERQRGGGANRAEAVGVTMFGDALIIIESLDVVCVRQIENNRIFERSPSYILASSVLETRFLVFVVENSTRFATLCKTRKSFLLAGNQFAIDEPNTSASLLRYPPFFQ